MAPEVLAEPLAAAPGTASERQTGLPRDVAELYRTAFSEANILSTDKTLLAAELLRSLWFGKAGPLAAFRMHAIRDPQLRQLMLSQLREYLENPEALVPSTSLTDEERLKRVSDLPFVATNEAQENYLEAVLAELSARSSAVREVGLDRRYNVMVLGALGQAGTAALVTLRRSSPELAALGVDRQFVPGNFYENGRGFKLNNGNEPQRQQEFAEPGGRENIVPTPGPFDLPDTGGGRDALAIQLPTASLPNLVHSDQPVLLGQRIEKMALDSSGVLEVTFEGGQRAQTEALVMATGLSRERLPFSDEETLRKVEGYMAESTDADPAVQFAGECLRRMTRARAPEKPYLGKDVLVVGTGDSGKTVATALGRELPESSLAESKVALGQVEDIVSLTGEGGPEECLELNLGYTDEDTGEERLGIRPRYYDYLGLVKRGVVLLDASDIVDLEKRFDPQTGERKFFAQVTDEEGEREVEADCVVFATGVEDETLETLSEALGQEVETQDLDAPVPNQDGERVVARQVKLEDGRVAPIYLVGAGAGQLVNDDDITGFSDVPIKENKSGLNLLIPRVVAAIKQCLPKTKALERPAIEVVPVARRDVSLLDKAETARVRLEPGEVDWLSRSEMMTPNLNLRLAWMLGDACQLAGFYSTNADGVLKLKVRRADASSPSRELEVESNRLTQKELEAVAEGIRSKPRLVQLLAEATDGAEVNVRVPFLAVESSTKRRRNFLQELISEELNYLQARTSALKTKVSAAPAIQEKLAKLEVLLDREDVDLDGIRVLLQEGTRLRASLPAEPEVQNELAELEERLVTFRERVEEIREAVAPSDVDAGEGTFEVDVQGVNVEIEGNAFL